MESRPYRVRFAISFPSAYLGICNGGHTLLLNNGILCKVIAVHNSRDDERDYPAQAVWN